jgi:virulence-associated protein VagC
VLGRFFKSGNSMAVRIPKELAFAQTIQEVETERIRNSLGVCPLDEQTRDLMDGETRDEIRLFGQGNRGRTTVVYDDSGHRVLCLFSPEQPWSVMRQANLARGSRCKFDTKRSGDSIRPRVMGARPRGVAPSVDRGNRQASH